MPIHWRPRALSKPTRALNRTIRDHVRARKIKQRLIGTGAALGASMVGVSAHLAHEANRLAALTEVEYSTPKPLLMKGIAIAGAIVFGAIAGMAFLPRIRHERKRALLGLGIVLEEQVRRRASVRAILETYRWVYVNSRGQLIGTNIPKLIIGYPHLRTSKILDGTYGKQYIELKKR